MSIVDDPEEAEALGGVDLQEGQVCCSPRHLQRGVELGLCDRVLVCFVMSPETMIMFSVVAVSQATMLVGPEIKYKSITASETVVSV